MLETLHLSKIYKTKGGADVRALDDVSIQFPEKGMVFLLGRSGSGKSTLLNVCGGLDAPTFGEIIVKGRSSKAFSQSDFDSYRNTFVGFVFQEYNILNEFTVEDNIALALELQGKPKDKKAIADLLEQVDLTGYAKRKPNTLSGGQKQRIAIARALVKSPEIIMADEPTGALDSATGKQVFETLKKLSKDKLVIVVSHDRDFAEQYGDRIIELMDGKVISDVTKTQEQQQMVSENVSVVGDTLCVKKGAHLSDEEFDKIKEFLSKTDSEVIIASGDKDVKSFKDANHIKENGEKEVFRDSNETAVERKMYRPEDSRFIRSKLPARHAFKIGVSSLKTKPIRLFFTILLCTVAFVFFGMLSTMTFYDNESTFKQSLKDSSYDLVQMGKMYEVTEIWSWEGEEPYEYSYGMNGLFTPAELEKYRGEFGPDVFGGIGTWYNYNIQSSPSRYWNNQISFVAYLPEGNSLHNKIMGKYPTKADEICISSYMADVIFNCNIIDAATGDVAALSTPKDIIGKKLTVSGYTYTVVGILDSGEISAKYDVIKDGETNNYQLISGLYGELEDGLHLTAFVSEERMAEVAEDNQPYSYDDYSNKRLAATVGIGTATQYTFPEYGNVCYDSLKTLQEGQEIMYLVDGKTSLSDTEVYVSNELFYQLVAEGYGKLLSEMAENSNEEAYARADKIFMLANQLMAGGVDVENATTNKWEFIAFTEDEQLAKTKELVDAIKADGQSLTLVCRLFDDSNATTIGETKEFSIVGIWDERSANDSYRALFNDKVATDLWATQKSNMDYYSEYKTDYVKPVDGIYGTLFIPYDHSDAQTNELWNIYENKNYDENATRISLTSRLVSNLEMVDMMVDELSKVFLYVGIVLAVFAALLLSNFISVSISYKKKEIGILRAVGARSIDVFKIFFSESFVITAICVLISVIGSIALCNMVNGMLIELIGASLFVFGMVSFLVLLGVALVTVIVATFLPVWNAAKKKPVESIRAL